MLPVDDGEVVSPDQNLVAVDIGMLENRGYRREAQHDVRIDATRLPWPHDLLEETRPLRLERLRRSSHLAGELDEPGGDDVDQPELLTLATRPREQGSKPVAGRGRLDRRLETLDLEARDEP